MGPDNFRHEDVTFQVPTTSPPQGDTFVQLSAPPEPALPPVLVEPPVLVLPPVRVEPPVPALPPVVEPPVDVAPPEPLLQPVPAAVAASDNTPTSLRSPCRIR
jgi:hypothetical protein